METAASSDSEDQAELAVTPDTVSDSDGEEE